MGDGIRFRSDIGVELVAENTCGGDRTIACAAWAEHPDRLAPGRADTPAGWRRTGEACMKYKHNSPFEQGQMCVYAEMPGVVWWQLTRQRFMSLDTEDFCLAGDSLVTVARKGPDGRPELRHVTIAELHRNRHVGRPWRIDADPDAGLTRLPSGSWRVAVKGMGRGPSGYVGTFRDRDEARAARSAAVAELGGVAHRKLAVDKSVTLRVLNERTQLFEYGEMADVFETGVQELLGVATEDGKRLRCTRNHRLLTLDGWKKAGELRAGDRVAVVGKRSMHPDRAIPKRLRQGIGLWTTKQRPRLIRDEDACHVCGQIFPRVELVLDHVVPVAACLRLALDESNLKPICAACNRVKVIGEQKLGQRGNVAGSKFVRLTRRPAPVAEEMTYDIEMAGEWHNFVADRFVVHNSFNLESGRYKHLEPEFYVPPPERPVFEPPGFKPMRPELHQAIELCESVQTEFRIEFEFAWARYAKLIAHGVAREVARLVLPNWALYCDGWVTGKVLTWLQFFSKRNRTPDTATPTFPQWEIEEFCRKCEVLFKERWPATYLAFVENGREAP